jgi:hypothetical protein
MTVPLAQQCDTSVSGHQVEGGGARTPCAKPIAVATDGKADG